MKNIEIHADGGTHISQFFTDLINTVKTNPEENVVYGVFNGIKITADKNSTHESLNMQWNQSFKENRDAWEASEEGKKYREQEAKELQDKLENLNNLMDTFDYVKKSYDNTLYWLTQYQDCSDYIPLNPYKKTEYILEVLKMQGYKADMNCGKDFNAEDKENVAFYIIGQCISCLERIGAIHQVVHKHYEKYQLKFGV